MASPEALQLMDGVGAAGGVPVAPRPHAANGWMTTLPPTQLLGWLIQTMLADGVLSDAEEKLLRTVAGRRGVSEAKLQQIVQAGRAGTLDVRLPTSRDEGRDFLAALAAAALVDGTLDEAEMALLKRGATQFGLSDYDVKMLLRRTRQDLLAGVWALRQS
jgi:uncharacterized tellurite resistance protein B-like protein